MTGVLGAEVGVSAHISEPGNTYTVEVTSVSSLSTDYCEGTRGISGLAVELWALVSRLDPTIPGELWAKALIETDERWSVGIIRKFTTPPSTEAEVVCYALFSLRRPYPRPRHQSRVHECVSDPKVRSDPEFLRALATLGIDPSEQKP